MDGVRKMLAGLACTLALGSAGAGELIQVPGRPDAIVGIYVDAPAAAPAWVMVLFAGGQGNLALGNAGPRNLTGNFLVRVAPSWVAAGAATALFDTPSDQPDGMRDGFRLSQAAAQDVAAAVGVLRQRYPGAKIALVGTSRGTITVGNVLKRNPALADAYVLTSPVTISHGGAPGLSGMSWEGNQARVLVLSNEGDACEVSPFYAAKRLAGDNGFAFIGVSSSQSSGPRQACEGASPHGFMGIESQVADKITGWLTATP